MTDLTRRRCQYDGHVFQRKGCVAVTSQKTYMRYSHADRHSIITNDYDTLKIYIVANILDGELEILCNHDESIVLRVFP